MHVLWSHVAAALGSFTSACSRGSTLTLGEDTSCGAATWTAVTLRRQMCSQPSLRQRPCRQQLSFTLHDRTTPQGRYHRWAHLSEEVLALRGEVGGKVGLFAQNGRVGLLPAAGVHQAVVGQVSELCPAAGTYLLQGRCALCSASEALLNFQQLHEQITLLASAHQAFQGQLVAAFKASSQQLLCTLPRTQLAAGV